MKDLGTVIGAVLGIAALIFFMPLIAALFGAFSGWVVGLFFGSTMRLFLAEVNLGHIAPWQLGMMLGFVGGFFRTHVNSGSK